MRFSFMLFLSTALLVSSCSDSENKNSNFENKNNEQNSSINSIFSNDLTNITKQNNENTNSIIKELKIKDGFISSGQCFATSQIKPKPNIKKVNILSKEGTPTLKTSEPVYKQVIEKVEIKPAVKKLKVIPAEYQTQEYDVVTQEAYSYYDRCKNTPTITYQNVQNTVGMCVVNVPEKTEKVKMQVLITPERTQEIIEPPVYEEVVRWVVEKPADTSKVQEIYNPTQAKPVQIVEYEGAPKLVERQILCDSDVNPKLFTKLQLALQREGYYNKEINGIYNEATIQALSQYQEDNGLASGLLTIESVNALNIKK